MKIADEHVAVTGGGSGLGEATARELARFGIRVKTVAPGIFLTPLLAELPGEVQQGLAAAIPFPIAWAIRQNLPPR